MGGVLVLDAVLTTEGAFEGTNEEDENCDHKDAHSGFSREERRDRT